VFIIVGSTGNLSVALQDTLKDVSISILPSSSIKTWIEEDGESCIERFILNLSNPPKAILNATGIVNPNKPAGLLDKVNYQLPRNLLTAANRFSIPLYTFGSIMERNPHYITSNNYLASKRKFKSYIDTLDKSKKKSHLHFLVHTWYGVNTIPSHMFLGQIIESLSRRIKFRMSSGSQMREYHHIQDDMKVVLNSIQQKVFGVLEINHGNPIKLREIAMAVFSHFNSMQYLEIDSSLDSVDESRLDFFKGLKVTEPYHFRDQISGIISFVEEQIR
jgi:nucleoside-diphosphate-sugar epimerase